jgi:hypothetical protein
MWLLTSSLSLFWLSGALGKHCKCFQHHFTYCNLLGTLSNEGQVVSSFFPLFIFLWHSGSFVPQSSLFLGGFVYHFFFYGHPLGSPTYKASFVHSSFSRFVLFFKGFFDIKGNPNGFWYFLLMFRSKAFLFVLLFPFLLGFQSQHIIVYFTFMQFL